MRDTRYAEGTGPGTRVVPASPGTALVDPARIHKLSRGPSPPAESSGVPYGPCRTGSSGRRGQPSAAMRASRCASARAVWAISSSSTVVRWLSSTTGLPLTSERVTGAAAPKTSAVTGSAMVE